MSATKLDVRVEQQLLNEKVEVNDPVGLKITTPNGFENYITQVNFGEENQIKSCVGNCFVFYQYSTEGIKTISVKAYSLSNFNNKFQTQITLNVSKPADRLPMNSIELNYIKLSETNIEVKLLASGGEPYLCDLSYGDSSNVKLKSIGIQIKYFLINNILKIK